MKVANHSPAPKKGEPSSMTSAGGNIYLRLGNGGRTGRWWCVVADENFAELSAAQDGTEVVAALWANYSREAKTRFERAFPLTVLGGCELPREVIEHHLLVEIYRPLAFPVLLAEQLIAEFTTGLIESSSDQPNAPQEVLLALPPSAGDPHRLARLIDSQLKLRHSRLTRFHEIISRAKAFTGFAIGAVTSCLGVIRLESFQSSDHQNRPLPAGNLYVVFTGEGAHTRHIWEEIDKSPAGAPPPMVLVLGHTPLEKRLVLRVEAKGGRVLYLMDAANLGAAVAALGRCSRELLRLHRQAERDLGTNLEMSFHVRTGAWFLRGLMHDRFLRGIPMADPESTVAVFGLIAHADSRLADAALRKRGARTVHWLHGVVEDGLHYRANSSVCLCQNQVDAELRHRHGAYGSCRVYAERSPQPHPMASHPASAPESEALVITNLIHPDSRFAGFGASWALTELLQMTANCFKKMGLQTFTWRPHPRESAVPEFRIFNQLALDLGFTVDNKASIHQQVKSHRHVITTFSGSIGDVAAAGGLPAIFAGLPYELEGHWGQLSDQLKFRTADELGRVLARLQDDQWATQQRLHLLRQYNQHPGDFTATESLLNSLRPEVPPLVKPSAV